MDQPYQPYTNKLYTWDELTNEVTRWDPEDLFKSDMDNGWETAGWLECDGKLTDVRATTNGRHFGLMCWAGSETEAKVKFTQDKRYREYQEEA